MNALEFRNIIDGSAGVMYRVALALTGCEADAADAVQDACLRLWEKRAKLAESANPSGYCVGAARNAALDIIRARHPAVGPEKIPEIASDADTATACESTETLAAIEREIARLPENQRVVITMRDLEDRSVDEIIQATGYTVANVKTLLCRARAALRKRFSV